MLLDFLVLNPDQPVDVLSTRGAFRPFLVNDAEAFFERNPSIMEEVRAEVQRMRSATRAVVHHDRMSQLEYSVERIERSQATLLRLAATNQVDLVRPNKFSPIVLCRHQLTFSFPCAFADVRLRTNPREYPGAGRPHPRGYQGGGRPHGTFHLRVVVPFPALTNHLTYSRSFPFCFCRCSS